MNPSSPIGSYTFPHFGNQAVNRGLKHGNTRWLLTINHSHYHIIWSIWTIRTLSSSGIKWPYFSEHKINQSEDRTANHIDFRLSNPSYQMSKSPSHILPINIWCAICIKLRRFEKSHYSLCNLYYLCGNDVVYIY